MKRLRDYIRRSREDGFNAVTVSSEELEALLDVAEAADRALTDRDKDPAVGVALADDLSDALDRLRQVAL